jgi:hypothetical protein
MPLKRPADRLQVFVFHLFASEPFAVFPGAKNVRRRVWPLADLTQAASCRSEEDSVKVYTVVHCLMLCLLAEWRSRGGVPLTAKALW